MIILILLLIVELAVIDHYTRLGKIEIFRIKSRFDLFALRDSLRLAIIKNEIKPNKWFEYLDTSITKAIENIDRFSLWEAAALYYVHGKDESILNARIEVEAALDLKENLMLKSYFRDYQKMIVVILLKRHSFLVFNLLRLMKLFIKLDERQKEKEIAELFSSAPETSTLLNYC